MITNLSRDWRVQRLMGRRCSRVRFEYCKSWLFERIGIHFRYCFSCILPDDLNFRLIPGWLISTVTWEKEDISIAILFIIIIINIWWNCWVWELFNFSLAFWTTPISRFTWSFVHMTPHNQKIRTMEHESSGIKSVDKDSGFTTIGLFQ